MPLEREDFESILKIHLDPIHRAISKLEENQEHIVNILTTQARQDESIKHIHENLEKADESFNGIYTRVRRVEESINNKLWDFVKIFIASLIAGIIGIIGGNTIK